MHCVVAPGKSVACLTQDGNGLQCSTDDANATATAAATANAAASATGTTLFAHGLLQSSLILTIIQEHDIGCSQSQCFFSWSSRVVCVTDTRAHIHTPIVYQDSRK